VAAPRGQVVEGNGWRASNDPIKVIWEVLRRLEALPATGRASEVVRFVMLPSIEVIGDLFADYYAYVKADMVSVILE
jgi:hypothetical protein